jgi:ABC-type transporter Mla MlaB component
MFRVTTDRRVNETVLKLEGRLALEWVGELARVIDASSSEDARVTLDLHDLSFADAQGVAVIRAAVQGGARLVGESQFIGALVAEEQRQ